MKSLSSLWISRRLDPPLLLVTAIDMLILIVILAILLKPLSQGQSRTTRRSMSWLLVPIRLTNLLLQLNLGYLYYFTFQLEQLKGQVPHYQTEPSKNFPNFFTHSQGNTTNQHIQESKMSF